MSNLVKINNVEVDINSGNTVISNALALGFIFHSDSPVMSDKSIMDSIRTGHQLVESLQDGIRAISTSLAMMNNSEDLEPEIKSLMWLIAGLSELTGQVNFEAGELQFKLDQKNGQA